ncbi:MAG: molybdopterin cofactor-binding domain-containing protein [Candidatus Rokuibacteriota bacterium]
MTVPLPPLHVTRRRFLQGSAAAGMGLLVGFDLPVRWAAAQTGDVLAPNAFVRIAPDNTVTIIAKHIEFGQGTYTGLATILAEELDADWSQVRVESAPADATRYNNLLFGAVQGTGGSTAIANSWEQLRKAGATARAMLVAAAAREWNVPAAEITVERGVLAHARSGRRATFGELASKAATLPPPADVTLKDPKDFKLIGRRLPRLDSRAKTDGTAQFTMDVYLPDMLTALIARPPRFGARVRTFDAAAALRVKGVTDVVQVPAGIAVLARSFWAARKGRQALKIDWDESGAERRGSEELFAAYRGLARQPGARARRDGDPEAAIAGAARVLDAIYAFPYLAHAPMEPLDCVVRLTSDGCEVWAGSQLQTVDQQVVAAVVGLPPDKVRVHTLLAGGSFGRRATPNGDVAGEAASIAKAIGGRQAVKLVWTREDDITGGRYRPLYVHRLRAGLDPTGRLVGWEHRIVGQSILKGTFFESVMVKNGIDPTSVEGATTLPYDIPNLGVELHTTEVGVPVLWWRSVGSTHTAFSTETFLDELAHAAGRDPVDLRRTLLKHHPRHLGVLELAAQKAGWDVPLPRGRARGIAVHESFSSFVAQVAEVSLGHDGRPKVERVVCAVDCGVAVNPDVIRAQMEGGIGYGLAAALWSEITLVEGRVQQSTFHDYRPLRIEEMPQVEVYIVPSAAPPTGVGEPGVPPIAPAVANALFHLTGRRVRSLPFARPSVERSQ